jgi:hexosaminidase
MDTFEVLKRKGITYSKAVFEVTTKVSMSPNHDGVVVELKSANDPNKIKYTTDGAAPTINSISYTNPVVITKSQTLKAAYFESGKQQSTVTEQTFYFNKATGKKITLVNQPHESYNPGGAFALIDGILGNRSKFGRDWLGFSGKDLNAIIDLGKEDLLFNVSLSVLANEASWIYFPKGIEVLGSKDGQNFNLIQQLSMLDIQNQKGEINVNFTPQSFRFIKVIATNIGKIPEGNPGSGNDAWLFVDEIGVN